MSKGLKIFLIVVAVVCGGGVVLMGVGMFYVKTQMPNLVEGSKKTIKEASAYGKGKQDRQCVVHVMKKSEPCGEYDFKCQVNGAVFLGGCLKTARRTAALCTGVPSESELMNSVKWRIKVCSSYPKVKTRVCQSIQAIVQKECAKRK